ncbi:MAG: hypothetical protein ACLFT2_00815 [Candidatus Brocadiia bacterium]
MRAMRKGGTATDDADKRTQKKVRYKVSDKGKRQGVDVFNPHFTNLKR